MAIQVKKMVTIPSKIEADLTAFIQTLGPITTLHSVGYVSTNQFINGESMIVIVVVFT